MCAVLQICTTRIHNIAKYMSTSTTSALKHNPSWVKYWAWETKQLWIGVVVFSLFIIACTGGDLARGHTETLIEQQQVACKKCVQFVCNLVLDWSHLTILGCDLVLSCRPFRIFDKTPPTQKTKKKKTKHWHGTNDSVAIACTLGWVHRSVLGCRHTACSCAF